MPRLEPATRAHLRQMMAWFPTRESCALWGGPEFRFPFTAETFVVDSKLEQLPSYVLIDGSGELCGFGQYYLRAGRCHLSRLGIAPSRRSKGLGTRLIELLIAEATRALGANEISLFVSASNPSARALYERLGFVRAEYPEPGFDLPNIDYMIRASGNTPCNP